MSELNTTTIESIDSEYALNSTAASASEVIADVAGSPTDRKLELQAKLLARAHDLPAARKQADCPSVENFGKLKRHKVVQERIRQIVYLQNGTPTVASTCYDLHTLHVYKLLLHRVLRFKKPRCTPFNLDVN